MRNLDKIERITELALDLGIIFTKDQIKKDLIAELGEGFNISEADLKRESCEIADTCGALHYSLTGAEAKKEFINLYITGINSTVSILRGEV